MANTAEKATVTARTVDEAKNELALLEEKVLKARLESEKLTRQNEAMTAKLEDALAGARREAEMELAKVASEKKKLAEEKAKLLSAQTEMAKTIETFRAEQETVRKDKDAAIKSKTESDALVARCNQFIRAVGEAVAKL